MENNLEDTLRKILPNIVKKDNDWYQDGFLYVKFTSDKIQLKTINEYIGKTISISRNKELLYLYLTYLKKFTSIGKVSNTKQQKISKECKNKGIATVRGAKCKGKCNLCEK